MIAQTRENPGLIARIRLLYSYRELIWMLTWRDIRVRYKHSVLGASWAVLPPLLMMAIFTFVFGTVSQLSPQALTGDATLPYAIFALGGLVPWTFFSSSLLSATTSLIANRQLVTKTYFPREVFPIAAVGGGLVDFMVSTGLLLAVAAIVSFMSGTWHWLPHATLLLLPVVVAVQVMFTVGLGLILAMANLFYRDVGFLFRSFIQLWMFLTCVVYRLEPVVPWKRVLIQLNPMNPIIQAYRSCLLTGEWPIDGAFVGAAGIAVFTLLLGWRWFSRREFEFAECI